MGELITSLFSAFTATIGGLTAGIKEAFINVLYVDPAAATPVISDIAKFGFVMFGLAMATGIVYGAVKLIKR